MKILILALLLVFSVGAYASESHHHHEGGDGQDGVDGVDGIDGVDGLNGLNGSDGFDGANGIHTSNLNNAMASSIALSNIDFSSSTAQWQVGVAVGGYGGEEALAFGVAKLVPKYDMLIKFSGTQSNSHTGYGVGLMWKIK